MRRRERRRGDGDRPQRRSCSARRQLAWRDHAGAGRRLRKSALGTSNDQHQAHGNHDAGDALQQLAGMPVQFECLVDVTSRAQQLGPY